MVFRSHESVACEWVIMADFVEWPRFRLGARVSVLTLIAVAFAGCSSDVTRFDSNPFASSNTPPADMTGSVSRAPASPTRRVEARPLSQPAYSPPSQSDHLPPPPRSNPSQTGVAAGAGGVGSYRPANQGGEVTGSLPPPTMHAPPAVTAAQPAPQRQAMVEHTTQTITVAQGDTLYSISRRHGISVAALMQANGITSPHSLHIGQRLIVPSRHAAAAAPAPEIKAAEAAATPAYGGFHIAGPGDTLSKIAHRYRVPLNELAKANKMQPYASLKLGQRLVIPVHAAEADRPTVAPQSTPAQITKPSAKQQSAALPAAHQRVAGLPPAENANLAKATDTPEEAKTDGGALFRWPARGRIVAAFGAKPNGQQNDGINIALPEGTPVKAAETGEVAYAGNELKGYGNLILIRHPNGFVTAYAHASELLVKRGDHVKRGQVIAKSGQTGNIGSPQLHFEIRKGSTPVDPAPYLGA
jgi:murein DD-endopeptidase MepM/ murein hydrolase activator NlpD